MKPNLRITVLGCGSSGGVPRVGGDWGVCDPNEPKNRRTRCSILVEQWFGEGGITPNNCTTVLIDSSPDLREQLLKAGTKRLDAVLYTHDHADQVHGLDDLRALAYRMRKRIPAYMDKPTKDNVFNRFGYCFEVPKGRVHPPILELKPLIKDGDKVNIAGPGGNIEFDVLGLSHGPTPSLGFYINGRIVYTPDVHDIAPDVLSRIHRPDYWIIDALRYLENPTHAHADKALSWLAQTQTKHGVLTNMHIDMDYITLRSELCDGQDVCHDGMTITL